MTPAPSATATHQPSTPTPTEITTGCRDNNPSLTFTPPTEFNADLWAATVTNFLNAGGEPQAIRATLSDIYLDPEEQLLIADVTADGQPELIISDYRALLILGCKAGQYEVQLQAKPAICSFIYCAAEIAGIVDMNANDVPELIVARLDALNSMVNTFYQILQWDGRQFSNLVRNTNSDGCSPTEQYQLAAEEELCMGLFSCALEEYPFCPSRIRAPCSPYCIQDLDGDGTLEFILDGEHWNSPLGPLTDIYKWDGHNFVFHHSQPLAATSTPPPN